MCIHACIILYQTSMPWHVVFVDRWMQDISHGLHNGSWLIILTQHQTSHCSKLAIYVSKLLKSDQRVYILWCMSHVRMIITKTEFIWASFNVILIKKLWLISVLLLSCCDEKFSVIGKYDTLWSNALTLQVIIILY